MSAPTINVQLKPQRFCGGFEHCRDGEHDPACRLEIDPILIPCPIPPTVPFTVRRGECACPVSTWRKNAATRTAGSAHDTSCPARPIRVTCTIGGKTWEESDVAKIETSDGALPSLEACRDRWALVKALVLGMPHHSFIDLMTGPLALELVTQRDAVFGVLAKVATLERSIFEAQCEYTSAMDEGHHSDWHRDPESYEMPSQKMMALYVERLIEQVGNLEGGE